MINNDQRFHIEGGWGGNNIPKVWYMPEYMQVKKPLSEVAHNAPMASNIIVSVTEFDDFKFVRGVAHEFGHALGIGDAYASSTRPEALNDGVNVFQDSLMKSHLRKNAIVSGNDIEMILWAFVTKEFQSYTVDSNGNSKVSQAFYE